MTDTVTAMTPKVYAVKEAITPELAEAYLATQETNRPLKKQVVRRLVGVIQRGEWVFNGETIKFDAGGRLIDGQHRLAAIIAGDQPIETLVVRNASELAQDTVDTGTRRTLLDALRMRGEKNAAALASAIGWLYRLQSGKGGATSGAEQYPTIQQGLTLLGNNPGLRYAQTVAYRVYSNARLPQGVCMALYYHLSGIDEQDAEVFFEHLASGAGLDEGHPILVLRSTLKRFNEQRPKPSQPYYAAITIKAWNAFKEGRAVTRLSWSPGGSRNEAFPTPRNY